MKRCKNCIYAKAEHNPYYIDGIKYVCKSGKSICFSATKREPQNIYEKLKLFIETKVFDN